MTDKHDLKPVMDVQSKGYERRSAIEQNDKHAKLLWVNGIPTPMTRPGNLGVEWCNAEIKHCQFNLGMQSLLLMYQRSILIALIINSKKWRQWKDVIEEESKTANPPNDIYLQMNNIFERLYSLSDIFEADMVPHLNVSKTEKKNRIDDLVMEDELAFTKYYESGAPSVTQLLHWFKVHRPLQQKLVYNQQILQDIFRSFESKFDPKKIRYKLQGMGIYYDENVRDLKNGIYYDENV
ncbi:MAG: hypothetical protein GY941_26925 [Planctomycetes bacterium]|nr:hypothetical protein [Planctomycetota bacterium]